MLREDHRLRGFGNGVLRKVFGCKSEEVTGREKTARRRASCSVLLTECYLIDRDKKDEVGRACGM
jgi:hypothetical protein